MENLGNNNVLVSTYSLNLDAYLAIVCTLVWLYRSLVVFKVGSNLQQSD